MHTVSPRKRILADLSLFLVAVVWGITFPLTKYVLEHLSPIPYIAVRFTLSTLVLLPFVWYALRRIPPRYVLASLAAGLALGFAYVTQTYGLRTASASVAAFITGLSVVLVPVFGTLLGRRPTTLEWLGVGVATVGLGLLTLHGTAAPGRGELLVLLCAIALAVQILTVDRVAPHVDPLPLGALQVAAVSAMCLLLLPLEPRPGPVPALVWIAVAAMALVATAGAFTVQSWAQRFTVPTHVGLLFAFEPVSAAIASRVWLGEALTWLQWLGAAAILLGIVLAEWKPTPREAPPDTV